LKKIEERLKQCGLELLFINIDKMRYAITNRGRRRKFRDSKNWIKSKIMNNISF